MPQNLSITEIRTLLRTREQLESDGVSDRVLRRMLAHGEVRRVQRNQYFPAAVWSDCWSETQHRIELVAATSEMRGGDGVAAFASAAVAHGIPFYRLRPEHVEFICAARTSSRHRARRHELPLDDEDVVQVDGILCTSLERTTYDLARTLPWAASVAAADAALRLVSVRQRRFDPHAADQWRLRMAERVVRSPGVPGIRQARRTVEFADGRAELPGESVSRVHLARLGFGDLELQVPVAGPNGRDYEVDIAIVSAKAFWEFDGKGKYIDEAKRKGRTLEEVLLDEKRREDWIRGTTQWRLARGEDIDITSSTALAARLAAFHIHPPRR